MVESATAQALSAAAEVAESEVHDFRLLKLAFERIRLYVTRLVSCWRSELTSAWRSLLSLEARRDISK